MKLETKIREQDDKLIIVLSDLVVRSGGLNAGDVFEVELQGKVVTIRNKQAANVSLDKLEEEKNAEDVYSRILREEELVLAK